MVWTLYQLRKHTYIRTTDTSGFLHSLTPDDYLLIHRPRSSGLGGGVGFFIRDTYKCKTIDSPNFCSFESMVISVTVDGHSLLLTSLYRPPGPCSAIFLDEFMTLISYLSSVDSYYYICSDFNIHIDVPGSDSHKFSVLLESCNLTQ